MTGRPRGARRCRINRVVGPVLVSAALVAAIEGGLRVAGYQAPVAGHASLIPALFEPDTRPDGTAVMRRRGEPVEFLAEKPANGFRVFVLGESSVHGYPYGPAYAFPAFLQRRLTLALPDHAVEVVNCGLEGIGSWHVYRIAEEVVRYDPDVVFIYAGHNDWLFPGPTRGNPALRGLLEGLRVAQLAAQAGAAWRRFWQRRPDTPHFDPAETPYGDARARAVGASTLSDDDRAWIAERFARNLRATVRLVRRAGAVPIVATMGQNLRDWRPGAWRYTPRLAAADRDRWTGLAKEGERRRRIGDCPGALKAYRAALRVDRRPAVLHFGRGRCLEELGRWGAARVAYRRASDLDEVPCGAPTAFNRIIRGAAEAAGAYVVDVASALERVSPHGLVGSALFIDHVHPTILGHQRIAAAAASAVRRVALPSLETRWIDHGYHDPSPDDILKAHPELLKQVYEARVLLFLVLNRPGAAQREAAAGAERFAELHGVVERMTWYLQTQGRAVLSPAGSSE